MIRVIGIIVLMAVSWTNSMADGAKVRVSGTEIVKGASLDLQIIAEGKDIQFPPITKIGGFPIEGSSTSRRMESSYINGSFSSRNIKTLHLRFTPEVDVTIPAFEVMISGKKYRTQPIHIRVVQPSKAAAKSVSGYSLSITSKKDTVYVGEPFVVTVELFEPRNSNVAKVEYTPPKFEGFFSKPLGGENLKHTNQGVIHELTYLLSAKKEGNFTVIPPRARVGIRSVANARRDIFGFFSDDVRWHLVRAKALKIAAKPLPAKTDLVGKFSVSSRTDTTQTAPNKPVTYTLRIEGEGSLEDFEAPKLEIDGVTIYSDDPKIQSRAVGSKVMGSYVKKYVLIADRSFEIPSLIFNMFDYQSGTTKQVATKSHAITMAASASSTPALRQKMTSQPKIAPAAVSGDHNRSILEDAEYYRSQEKQRITLAWWHLIVAFLGGGAVVLLGMVLYPKLRLIRFTKKPLRRYSNKEALDILYPHTNDDPRIEAVVRSLYAVQNGDKKAKVDPKELAQLIAMVQSKADSAK